MSKFYGEVLGLKQITNEKGWREFAAGGARIALHSGPSSPGCKGPKIVSLCARRLPLVAPQIGHRLPDCFLQGHLSVARRPANYSNMNLRHAAALAQ